MHEEEKEEPGDFVFEPERFGDDDEDDDPDFSDVDGEVKE
uniref:Uncharacterized protein n=1 Tax=Arundo donax TaxID=35708 RepID=A0A0A9HMD4_ARUDO